MNQIIKNTIIHFVITLVAGICLGTVHDITLDPIAQAQEAAATKTYQEVYPDAASFDEPQELADAVLRRPEGAEPTALAEECFMPKQTVTGLLDQLERAGFIRRERCETDRRRTRVFCLPAGDVFVTGIMEELDRHEQAALASISAEDMETFNNVYAAIVDGLEKHLFSDPS